MPAKGNRMCNTMTNWVATMFPPRAFVAKQKEATKRPLSVQLLTHSSASHGVFFRVFTPSLGTPAFLNLHVMADHFSLTSHKENTEPNVPTEAEATRSERSAR